MVSFPNCKINLGLNVLRKRNDGYHDLETVFYPLPFCDILEIITAKGPTDLINTGIQTGSPHENLCIKAYELLKKEFPALPNIHIFLHKLIPAGAGLGGGSSDAAFMLRLLNQKFRLNIPDDKLFDYALTLGSDCPFFILNRPAFAASRGEKLENYDISLSGYKIVIVHPGISLSTASMFNEVDPAEPAVSIKETLTLPVQDWKYQLINDFEKPVFRRYPEIKKIKELLYEGGALYAALSGSGSAVYGIFDTSVNIKIVFPGHYLVKEIML